MDKQIALSKEELQLMLNEAGNARQNTLSDAFFNVTGCDISCSLEFDINIRNGDKKIAPLRGVFNHHNINFRIGFDILRDYGFIENYYLYEKNRNGEYKRDKDGNKIPTDEIDTTKNRLTVDGFRELNGIEPQSRPMISEIAGCLYVDQTDNRYENLISKIKGHPDYDESKIYNAALKDRKLTYSKHELELVKQLDIEIIKTKEITDES